MGTKVAVRAPLEAQEHENLNVNNTLWIVGTTPKVYGWEIDNSANSAAVYFKVWDAASPSVGTTAPHWCIKVPAGAVLPWPTVGGDGHTFTAKCNMACVTTPGTDGTSAPANPVGVKAWTDGS